MNRQAIAIGALFCFSLISCNNAAQKEETPITTSVDSSATVTTTASATELPYDPDPTDSIGTEQYVTYATSKETADMVRRTIQNDLKADLDKNLIDSFSRQFIFFEYDLNDDGKNEIFVGFRGPYFCGSGGCTQYLLDHQGNIITRFSVSGYPVVIDNKKTNGYKDLFIHSGRKDRIVKFDGKKYPSNPSLLPSLNVLPGDDLPRALNFIDEPYPWFHF
jgi:hypothetical protein